MEEAVGEKRSAGGTESQSELQEKKNKKKSFSSSNKSKQILTEASF